VDDPVNYALLDTLRKLYMIAMLAPMGTPSEMSQFLGEDVSGVIEQAEHLLAMHTAVKRTAEAPATH
jgi:hypothetical protein